MKVVSVNFLCPIKINVQSDSGDELSPYDGFIDFANRRVISELGPEIEKQILDLISQGPSSLKMPDALPQFNAIKNDLGNKSKSYRENVDAQPEFKSSKYTNPDA